MDIGSNPSLIAVFALVFLLAVFGPPVWWYSHGRKPGERREKNWGAILFGALVLISIGYVKPSSKGDWFGWVVNVGRITAGAWIIAWGAKGTRLR